MKYMIVTINNWNNKTEIEIVNKSEAKEMLFKKYLVYYIKKNLPIDKINSHIEDKYGIIVTRDNQRIEIYIIEGE